MRVLVVASHPQNATGYGRVTNSMTNYLVDKGHDVIVYAIRSYFHVKRYVDDRIKILVPQKCDGTAHNYSEINKILEIYSPDCLFIYDEPPVILNYVNKIHHHLRPPKLYLYLDIVFPYMKEILIKEIKRIKPTQIFTFLNCWRRHLIDDLGFDKNIVSTLPHGIDINEFYPHETGAVSKNKIGLDADDFLVLNINRLSLRKQIPVTVRVFLEFLIQEQMNPKIKLYLHSSPKGYNGVCAIEEIIRSECKLKNIDPCIILSKHVILSGKSCELSESELKTIYNASDVGINTCYGEGFGLPSIEHSCFNKPQIVTGIPVFKETLKDIGYFSEIEYTSMDNSDPGTTGLIMKGRESDFVKHLKHVYHNKHINIDFRNTVIHRYNWDNTFRCMDKFFNPNSLKLTTTCNKGNMKLLFLSTHPKVGTGYSKVANKITNYMANIEGLEVVYFAFQCYDESIISDRYVDPRIKIYEANKIDPQAELGLGYNAFIPILSKERPDAIFIYYEPSCIINFMNMIPPHLVPKYKYFYVDLFYKWEKMKYFTDIMKHNPTQIFTFLNCWRDHLINDIGIDNKKITTLTHGIEFEKFTDISSKESKTKLGFDCDDFIVLNMNRNNFRKGTDVTIRCFIEFLIQQNMNSKIKLYMGCDTKRDRISFDLIDLINVTCLKNKINPKVVFENHIFFSSKPHFCTETKLNLIYNAADVGLNTCRGEGFGLCVLEHAFFNKPQIVSSVPAIIETSKDFAFFADIERLITVPPFDCTEGELIISKEEDFIKHLNYVYENRYTIKIDSRKGIIEKYSWENAYKVLDQFFRK